MRFICFTNVDNCSCAIVYILSVTVQPLCNQLHIVWNIDSHPFHITFFFARIMKSVMTEKFSPKNRTKVQLGLSFNEFNNFEIMSLRALENFFFSAAEKCHQDKNIFTIMSLNHNSEEEKNILITRLYFQVVK